MLDFLFNRRSNPPPPVYLDERDVLQTLRCEVPYGATVTDGVGDPGSPDQPYAQYTFNNFSDGKTFEFALTSRQPDGKTYNSYVKAERVARGALEIKAIVFDNEPEDVHNAKEIYSVLNVIGEQVRDVFLWELPKIHENKGLAQSGGPLHHPPHADAGRSELASMRASCRPHRRSAISRASASPGCITFQPQQCVSMRHKPPGRRPRGVQAHIRRRSRNADHIVSASKSP